MFETFAQIFVYGLLAYAALFAYWSRYVPVNLQEIEHSPN